MSEHSNGRPQVSSRDDWLMVTGDWSLVTGDDPNMWTNRAMGTPTFYQALLGLLRVGDDVIRQAVERSRQANKEGRFPRRSPIG